jgi:hypothetical protein
MSFSIVYAILREGSFKSIKLVFVLENLVGNNMIPHAVVMYKRCIIWYILIICSHNLVYGFTYTANMGKENKGRGNSWKYLTRFCFSKPPVESVNPEYVNPKIEISLTMKYYPGTAILINWEDNRALAACSRAECKNDVTWSNFVKDTTTCRERKDITTIAGDIVKVPDLFKIYEFASFKAKNHSNEVSYGFDYWDIKCLPEKKQSSSKNYRTCLNNVATYNTSIDFVGDTERWYYFSIASCNHNSDYPLLIDKLSISLTNHGLSANERLLSSNNYYLPTLLITLGCLAIVYTIVGSIFLHVYLQIRKLHYMFLILMLIIYIQDIATLAFL